MSWQESVPDHITELPEVVQWVAGTLLKRPLIKHSIEDVSQLALAHWPGEHVAVYRIWLHAGPRDDRTQPPELLIAVDLYEYQTGAKYFCNRIMDCMEGPWGPPPAWTQTTGNA